MHDCLSPLIICLNWATMWTVRPVYAFNNFVLCSVFIRKLSRRVNNILGGLHRIKVKPKNPFAYNIFPCFCHGDFHNKLCCVLIISMSLLLFLTRVSANDDAPIPTGMSVLNVFCAGSCPSL